MYSKLLNRTLDANSEVLVTAGAYEALYATIQGHTNPGDEWIIIEPFFDCYEPMVRSAGGVPRFIALKPVCSSNKYILHSYEFDLPKLLHRECYVFQKSTNGPISSADWVFDRQELASLFNEKTKGIIVNTPHNPVGKVFTLDELQFIANLAKKWNTIVVSDEVYEWIVYEPYKHVRIGKND